MRLPGPLFPRHVYVHVPFCERRCSYCDFSIAVRRSVPVDEYLRALEREVAVRFSSARDWTADTLYFGGGTPSRLGAAGMSRVISMLREHIALAPDPELTVEANPEDVTHDTVEAWRSAGVNRLSVGAQSFNDRVLAWMHRTHDAAAIGRAVDTARRGGIENVSIDLIFALPESLDRSWAADLDQAIALDPWHISLYGLTIETHTPIGRWRARGEVTEAPDERYESEFLRAHDAMSAAGFDHYEVSNFAKPGMRSRHNSSYWSGVPYVGLGPSAHEFDGSTRWWNTSAYVEWLRRLDRGEDPVGGCERLSDENRSAETVYLGLRTKTGLELSTAEAEHVERWVESGWAELDSELRIVLTPIGWLRLDALAADLTVLRSRY